MPDLIPAKDGIVDRHPVSQDSKKIWIPGQARNDETATDEIKNN